MYSVHLLIHSKIFPIGTFKIRISVRQMTKISLYMHFYTICNLTMRYFDVPILLTIRIGTYLK